MTIPPAPAPSVTSRRHRPMTGRLRACICGYSALGALLSAACSTNNSTITKEPTTALSGAAVFETSESLPKDVAFQVVATVNGKLAPAPGPLNASQVMSPPDYGRRVIEAAMARLAWQRGANAVILLKIVNRPGTVFWLNGRGVLIKLKDPNVLTSLHINGAYIPVTANTEAGSGLLDVQVLSPSR